VNDLPAKTQPYLFLPFRRQDALAVGGWRYDGAYAFYNQALSRLVIAATMRPLWSLMGLDLFSVVTNDAAHELVGIFTYTRQGRNMEIGLQMHPMRTGQGAGLAFVEAGLAFGRARYRPKVFILFVAEFNVRAITVYERAGFRKIRRAKHVADGGRTWHWEMQRDER
jgi:[ribosomal protein S18]-alanine N-acetyltransferase